jgi:hypothetical protein
LIQVRATDADLERALRPVNLTQPNKGYSAQLGISTPQANMQGIPFFKLSFDVFGN